MNTETNVAPDAATEIPASEVVQEPEVTTPEQVEDTEQGDPSQDADRALKKLQRRIDRRTADLYRERAEKEQLAQRLAEMESQRQTEPQKPTTGLSEADIRAKAAEIARQERFNEQCNAIVEKGKKLPEFDKALRTLVTEAGPLIDARGGPTPLMTVVLESEKPEALLHYLGSNPDVASELEGLSVTQLARRVDRIERDMATPKTSKAPKPLEPVRPQSSSAAPSDSDSTEDWIRKEAARLNARKAG